MLQLVYLIVICPEILKNRTGFVNNFLFFTAGLKFMMVFVGLVVECSLMPMQNSVFNMIVILLTLEIMSYRDFSYFISCMWFWLQPVRSCGLCQVAVIGLNFFLSHILCPSIFSVVIFSQIFN